MESNYNSNVNYSNMKIIVHVSFCAVNMFYYSSTVLIHCCKHE